MKKYSFRLQTVLEIREKKLENKRREMAEIIKQLNEQNQVLGDLISKQTNVRGNLENIYNGGEELDITEITNYKDYLGKVIVDAKNQGKIIEQTQYLLRFKQLEVTEALKEVKIFEKLKETQEKKFYQHYDYVQAKEIDDISSTRYNRVLI
ncbi:MAG: flagellar export protein FliJ [bacterium]